MPPPEQPRSRLAEAGVRASPRRAPRARGSAARSPAGRCRRRRRAAPCPSERHEPVEPEPEERASAPARARDLEAADPPAGPQHARAARARPASRSSMLRIAEADGGGVEAPVRRTAARARRRAPTRPAPDLRRARSSIRSEKSRPVTRPPARCASSARSPVPQHASSTAVAGPHDGAGREPAPAAVEAGRHHAVHRVVDRRDAVEHGLDGGRGERAGAHCAPPADERCSMPSWSRQRATTKSTSRRSVSGCVVEARSREDDRRPGAAQAQEVLRWIVESGVSRGHEHELPLLLQRHGGRAVDEFAIAPAAMRAAVAIEHGQTT